MSNPEISSKPPKATVNVHVSGPGKDGYTPQRGKDYWTEDDKQVIRNYVDSSVRQKLVGTTDEITPTMVMEELSLEGDVSISYIFGDAGPIVFTSFVVMQTMGLIVSSTVFTLEEGIALVQLIGDLNDNHWRCDVVPMFSEPQTPITDPTLSVAEVPADSFAVNRAMTNLGLSIPVYTKENAYMDGDGTIQSCDGFICKYTNLVNVIPGDKLCYQGFAKMGVSVVWVNAEGVPVGSEVYTSDTDAGWNDTTVVSSTEFTVPVNAAFAIFASTEKINKYGDTTFNPLNVYRSGERIGDLVQLTPIVEAVNKLKRQITSTGYVLVDPATGYEYVLYVYDGKLTLQMREVETE